MSFSKAKLKRFNEMKDPTPSPTKYDPKVESKALGVAVLKSERFPEKSGSTTDLNVSVSHIPVFRTPLPYSKSKSKRHGTAKKSSASSSRRLFRSVEKQEQAMESVVTEAMLEQRDYDEFLESMNKYGQQQKLEKDAAETNKKLLEKIEQLEKENSVMKEENMILVSKNEALVSAAEDVKQTADQCERHEMFVVLAKKIEDEIDSVKVEIVEQDKVKKEMEESTKQLVDQNQELERKVSEVKYQNHKYEIAISDTRISLDVLGERLMESEDEIVKLNRENANLKGLLKEKELCINIYRTDCDLLKSTIEDLVEREKRRVVEQDEMENKFVEVLNTIINDVKIQIDLLKHGFRQQVHVLLNMEQEFAADVDRVKTMCVNNIDSFVNAAMKQIEQLEQVNDSLLTSNLDLEDKLSQLTDKYDNLSTDFDIRKTLYDIMSNNHAELLSEHETTATDLEKLKAAATLALESLNAKNDLLFQYKDAICVKDKIIDTLQVRINSGIATLEENRALGIKIMEAYEVRLEALRDELVEKNKAVEKSDLSVVRLHTSFMNEKNLNETLRAKGEDTYLQFLSLQDLYVHAIHNICDMNKKLSELTKCTESWEMRYSDAEKDIKRLVSDLQIQQAQAGMFAKIVHERECLTEHMVETGIIVHSLRLLAEDKCKQLGLIKSQLVFEINEAKDALKCEQDKYNKLHEEMNQVTSRKEYYKLGCVKLEKIIKDLNDELSNRQTQTAELESLMEAFTQLEKLNKELSEKNSQYEDEILLLEHDLTELREMHLQETAKSGHRNPKQKIKYLVKLKNDLLELKTQNERLQLEKTAQKKTLADYEQKLGITSKRWFIGGRRPTETPFKGKENVDKEQEKVEVKEEDNTGGVQTGVFKERN